MKVLLIGEYSRLHNSLKEGLIKLGHEVTIVAAGDGFKNFPVDINISSFTSKYAAFKLISKLCLKLFNFNLNNLENYYRFKQILPKLKDYDVVQIINERTINTNPDLEIKLLKTIKKQNKKLFLLSCGTDYSSIKYANDKQLKYSILTPYHNNKTLKKEYQFLLNYLEEPHLKLYSFLMENVDGIIASDIDYHLPLLKNNKYLGLIPNPINTDIIAFKQLKIDDKINVFYGLNTKNRHQKGSVIIEKALQIIKQKHPDKVNITTTENLPYKTYISAYNKAHILIDQVYSYDQGYNALEAMAKGKVVFSGAEKEWLDYYNLEKDTAVFNALPSAEKLANAISFLIMNPDKITEVSSNARAFIEREHHYIESSKKYLNLWESSI